MRAFLVLLLLPLALQAEAPSTWTPATGEGTPRAEATFRDGASYGVRGGGEDSVYWKGADLAATPGSAWVFRVRAKGTGAGTLIVGPSRVNRDFPPPRDWTTLSYALRLPDAGEKAYLRLGEWHLAGEALFDGAELVPARVVHRRWGEIELGEGESLDSGRYLDHHDLGGPHSTLHRTLQRQAASFNTNRWTFGEGDEVVYRHALPRAFKSARVSLHVGWRSAGALEVAASRDGASWTPIGEAKEVTSLDLAVPPALFPTMELFVRLRAGGKGAWVQVDAYAVDAQVDDRGGPRAGRTLVLAECTVAPNLQATWEEAPGGWIVRWKETGGEARSLDVTLGVDATFARVGPLLVAPGREAETKVALPPLTAGPHEVVLRAAKGKDVLYEARTSIILTALDESGYGVPLGSAGKDVAVWACEAAWKVGLDRDPPKGKAAPIAIEAARGEHEAVQIVLRATKPGLSLVTFQASDLVCGHVHLAASEIALREVARVRIEHPTDEIGGPGAWPDPLPPLALPMALPEGNLAVWVDVHVPETQFAADYRGTIRIGTTAGELEVPVTLHVFEFTLPRTPTLRSGFGLDAGLIRSYHRLETPEQERAEWDLYMADFAAHRISPYSFFAHDPIVVREEDGHARVDWTGFDAAAKRCLDDLGFSAFSLPVEGMGGGSYHDHVEGELLGHKVGSPEYEALFHEYAGELQEHLREHKWLDKAYVYWFDEPEPKDYPFVIEGMKRLKTHAPRVKRLLTEQPAKELVGHVDLWCGLTPEWTPEGVKERTRAGDEVWWYVCTGPRAPYVGLFSDHPAAEMRLWAWQSWQYGVQGILIWQTNYWTSDAAFPDSPQDPWADPMSYVSGTGTAKGTKQPWGNGDGRFFYPPRGGKGPVVEPPIPSIRWECLRDGVEDYEYLAILRAEVERTRGSADDALLTAARELLVVPEGISKDTTHFVRDVRPIVARRHAIAEMIQKLQLIR